MLINGKFVIQTAVINNFPPTQKRCIKYSGQIYDQHGDGIIKMANSTINTHTQYNFYARELQKANEAITQTNKYLLEDSPHYLPKYIATLEGLRDSNNPPEGIDEKIATAKTNFANYTKRADNARLVIAESPALIEQLESNNDIYLTPEDKQNECLYVMDGETCKSSCIDWKHILQNIGQDISTPEPEAFVFKGKQDIELTGEHQTDALRVWHHNVSVENLKITDNRHYTDAHRDAIQLIPPPMFRMDGDTYVRLGDQMAGAVLENTSIKGCEILAPNGPLQGIFASDGLQRNLSICDNDIGTYGAYAISISGLLDGGEISGNTLRALPGGQKPRIGLYPARIGGNMADDGVVSILSFAPTEARKPMEYAEVTAKDNYLLDIEGKKAPLEIADDRDIIPNSLLKFAVGLTNFDYHRYLADYSSLTLGEYRRHDPVGLDNMQAWLTLRLEEFTNGRDESNPLGPVSEEQKGIGARFLKPALGALIDGSADETRLVDLELTAIRSFAMKRLAIMHGTVEPLIDVALLNPRRELMLSFLLDSEQMNNMVRVGHVDSTLTCLDSKLPAALIPFSLFFGTEQTYQGVTDEQGKIEYDQLPVGPYIMTLNNDKFALAASDSEAIDLSQAVSEGAQILAATLLKDFANKMPIVRAWLKNDDNNKQRGENALALYLDSKSVSADIEITQDLRHQCFTVLGLGSSHREKFRQQTSRYVQCPKPVKTGGCLFAIINLVTGLFKKK